VGVEEIARGTLTEVGTTPREVFKGAILTNAASIILAHNHPSGEPTPSSADIEVTREMARAGKLLGIPVRDHVIVGAEGCTSLRVSGPSSIEFAGTKARRRRRRRRQR
jgi:DNA repair protein RadC